LFGASDQTIEVHVLIYSDVADTPNVVILARDIAHNLERLLALFLNVVQKGAIRLILNEHINEVNLQKRNFAMH
jgi:hypothetical protein